MTSLAPRTTSLSRASGLLIGLLLVLPGLLLTLPGLVLALPGPGADDPPAAVDRLRRGESSLRRGEIDEGVRLLRELLELHGETRSAVRGREILAREGFGRRIQVLLDDSDTLRRRGVDVPAIIASLESRYLEIEVFLDQALGASASLAFQVQVLDSRQRYLESFEKARRRSRRERLAGSEGGGARCRVSVYYDVRLPRPADALEIIQEGALREMAAEAISRRAGRPLPASLEVGLSEYLALRLFPREISSVRKRLEDLSRAEARRGLALVSRFEDFTGFLGGVDPRSSLTPRVTWRWVAVAYAFTDFLLHGGLVANSAREEARTPAVYRRAPRNRELQELLRDYGRLAPPAPPARDPAAAEAARARRLEVIETLIERHYRQDLRETHRAFLRYVQTFPFTGDDLDQLPEL